MNARDILRTFYYPVIAWLMAFLFAVSGQIADPDLWGRLSVAALTVQRKAFPYFDVFSYTAPHARWIDHEWLTGFVFYFFLVQLGEPWFVGLNAALMLTVIGLAFLTHRRLYQVSPLYAFYGVLALLGILGWGWTSTMRSQMFSFALFAVFITLLEAIRLERLRQRWLWALIPLGILWGNLHGGFIMGVLLLGCYGLATVMANPREGVRLAAKYWLVGLLIVVSLGFCNPYGWDYIVFLLKAWTWDRSLIGEWSSLRFGNELFLELQALILVMSLILLANWWPGFKTKRLPDLSIVLPTLVLGLLMAMSIKSLRMQTFFAIGAIYYAPLVISSALLQRELPKAWVRWFQSKQWLFLVLLPGLLGAMTVVGLVFMQRQPVKLLQVPVTDELTQGNDVVFRYPVAALRYLEQSPYHGKLLVRFGLGEFAYWRLYPRFKVSMDGRYEEVYTQQAFLRNDAFFNRHKHKQSIQAAQQIHHSPADFILIEADMPNLAALEKSGQWQLLYNDYYFQVWGRNRFKPYVPIRPIVTERIMTLRDFVGPDTLKRFKP